MMKLISVENEFNDIEDGKTTTIRKGYRDIKLGLLEFESLNKRTINVFVTYVIHCIVMEIPMEFVKSDLFTDKHDLLFQLKEYYPDIDEYSEVTIIRFNHIK